MRSPELIEADLRRYYNTPPYGAGGWPYIKEASDCLHATVAERDELLERAVTLELENKALRANLFYFGIVLRD